MKKRIKEKFKLVFLNMLEEARFTGQGWQRPAYSGKIYILILDHCP